MSFAISAATSRLNAELLARTPVESSPTAYVSSILDKVALNPQPLPPKSFSDRLGLAPIFHRFDAVALNPQPLPPRSATLVGSRLLDDDWCGTVPKRLPVPPPPAPWAEVLQSLLSR